MSPLFSIYIFFSHIKKNHFYQYIYIIRYFPLTFTSVIGVASSAVGFPSSSLFSTSLPL